MESVSIEEREMSMEMENQQNGEVVLELTAEVVAAYVSNNIVPAADIPSFIEAVHGALKQVGNGETIADLEKPKPAVSVKKSITDDYLICLEDGKPFKSLKRHLKTHYDLSPDQYRDRWGLPSDYPMVAPNYAKQRSKLAKQMGLGRKAAG